MAKTKREPDAEDGDDAPGWDAITAAFETLYPRQKNPPHFAPYLSPMFTGGGLQGVSAYKAEGPKHWHFVTYGLTELYANELSNTAVSGWGFELTFRLTRKAKDAQPPNWAVNFLFNLGKYVYQSGNPFGAGHYMDLNGPIALGEDTAIRAIAFVRDPQLGPIDSPNGSVEFIQVVGLTLDELAACSDWKTEKVMGVLTKADPLLVTDLGRPSLFADPKAAKAVERGIEKDGSQSDRTFVGNADWKKAGDTFKLTLGARAVQSLLPKLRSRLMHGRNHALVGKKRWVDFAAGKRSGVKADGDGLTVTLSPAALRELMTTLQPVRGKYPFAALPKLRLEVVPTELTDADGNVVEVIG